MFKKILLILCVFCMVCISAGATDLKQVDVSRSSNSSVDVTLYTTGASTSPMVTRKATNTYVILMPNVGGKNAGSPDLDAVKDMVTDVKIKNVDDGMSGYTKITFTTTKPLNIQAHLKRTTPITEEEREAKTIIANAKTAIKPAVASKVVTAQQKPAVSKDVVTKSNTKADKDSVAVKTDKKTDKRFEVFKKQQANTEIVVKKVEKSVPKPVSAGALKQAVDVDKNVTDNNVKEAVSAGSEEVSKNIVQNDVTNLPAQPVKYPLNHKVRNVLIWIGLALLGFVIAIKNVKNVFKTEQIAGAAPKDTQVEEVLQNDEYSDIVNDKNLSWQEKYRKFNQKAQGNATDDTQYAFTSNLTYTKVDDKRLELERTLDKVPEFYKTSPDELTENKVDEVSAEENTIAENMNPVKLKSFTNPISLNTAHRNRYKKQVLDHNTYVIKEGKFVQLNESVLNKTSRGFADANLSVSELVKTGNRYIDDKTVVNSDYSISSLEEYVDLLDEHSATNTEEFLSNKVAQDLRNIKPSMDIPVSQISRHTNPLSIEKQPQNYMKGLIVKASYNIDNHRSFHLVGLDGQNAIIGRIDEEIFVLKKVDKDVNTLHVKSDKDNIYIVQAGRFRSVIGVENNKMGVLIEL